VNKNLLSSVPTCKYSTSKVAGVVQRGTDHAWENRSGTIARAAFFHIDARFSEELLVRLPKPLVLTG
jgi:hypothetical protein